MEIKANPYSLGNPITNPSKFIGRGKLLKNLIDFLHGSTNNAYLIYGQRRIGKTSILLHLKRILEDGQDGIFPIYLDLMPYISMNVDKIMPRLAEEIAIKVGLDTIEFSQESNTNQVINDILFPKLRDSIKGKRILFMLDEFDALDINHTSPQDDKVISSIKYLVENNQDFKFIFVSGQNILDLSLSFWSYLNSIPNSYLQYFDHDSVTRVTKQSANADHINWTQDCIETIFDYTGGHPYLTQLVASVVWENLWRNNKQHHNGKTIASQDIVSAIPDVIFQSQDVLLWIWNNLNYSGKTILSVLASNSNSEINQSELFNTIVEKNISLVTRDIENTIRALVETGLIIETSRGLKIKIGVFREWISKYHKTEQIRRNIGKIDPVWDKLFQAADSLVYEGEKNRAEELLRLSLKFNPGHIETRLLLVDLLVSSNRLEDSISILEDSISIDPVFTGKFIHVLSQYSDTVDDYERIKVFKKIIELTPTYNANRTVLDLISNLKEKAIRFEDQQDYENALFIYDLLIDEFPNIIQRKLESRKLNVQKKSDISKLFKLAHGSQPGKRIKIYREIQEIEPANKEASKLIIKTENAMKRRAKKYDRANLTIRSRDIYKELSLLFPNHKNYNNSFTKANNKIRIQKNVKAFLSFSERFRKGIGSITFNSLVTFLEAVILLGCLVIGLIIGAAISTPLLFLSGLAWTSGDTLLFSLLILPSIAVGLAIGIYLGVRLYKYFGFSLF